MGRTLEAEKRGRDLAHQTYNGKSIYRDCGELLDVANASRSEKYGTVHWAEEHAAFYYGVTDELDRLAQQENQRGTRQASVGKSASL